MKRVFFVLILLLIPGAMALNAATAERPMLLRVSPENRSQIEFLRKGNFDIAYVSKAFIEIVADDLDYNDLLVAGFTPEIVHQDLVAFYQSRNPLATTMGGFRTLSEILAFMDSLHQANPTITTARQSIGTSIEGRDIWMMKISDNPDQDEDEPKFFVNSLIHAREPMGGEATVRFMAYLCSNYGSDQHVTDLVNNREFYFVPVINPDGYEYNRQTNPYGGGMWRKNRRNNGGGSYGIDLNRNWGYMWGYDDIGSSPDPNSEVYRGSGPFSEPETEALRQFINGRHFSVVMNFHSYADDFLYPWGYYNGYTPDNPLFSAIGDSACSQNGYVYGTPWEVLYNTNGDACDWQYGEQAEKPKILPFVIEIGTDWDGFWPDQSRIQTLWEEVLPPLMLLADIAGNPYSMSPPATPVMYPIGDVYGDTFTVRWSFADTLNPATAFELKELAGLERIEDGFENGTSNWNLNGYVLRTNRKHSGTYSLFSGTADNYNGSAVLVNEVSIAANDSLKVWVWYSIENGYDYAYVQASTDGGTSFTNLAGNITTNNNPYGNNRGNGITGNSNGWVLGKFPLADYAGQSILLGMRYITDGYMQNEGFYADQFNPVETFSQVNILGSDITDSSFVVTGRTPGNYYYQVRAVDAQNQWSAFSNRELAVVHTQTSVADQPVPFAFTLDQNYPNPFNPQTSISFTLSERSRVNLSVYNVLGMKVRTLVDSEFDAGPHSVVFDSHDDQGSEVAQGVYFYKLKTESGDIIRKMVLLK